MRKIAVLYFSGYGHTVKQAEAISDGISTVPNAEAITIKISEEGTITDSDWADLAQADGIIYGSPTYMGGPAWQFKKVADASSKVWFEFGWKDKIAGGFTTSASLNGDKGSTISYFMTLSQQHGQIWVGTGQMPASQKDHGPDDVNRAGGFSGALAIAPADASPEEGAAKGDMESAKLYGQRLAEIATKMN